MAEINVGSGGLFGGESRSRYGITANGGIQDLAHLQFFGKSYSLFGDVDFLWQCLWMTETTDNQAYIRPGVER